MYVCGGGGWGGASCTQLTCGLLMQFFALSNKVLEKMFDIMTTHNDHLGYVCMESIHISSMFEVALCAPTPIRVCIPWGRFFAKRTCRRQYNLCHLQQAWEIAQRPL